MERPHHAAEGRCRRRARHDGVAICIADAATRTSIVALLERPMIFAETLTTLLGVDPTASLSWSLHVKRLLSAQIERLFRHEVGLANLDEFVLARRPAVADLRADAATLARSITPARCTVAVRRHDRISQQRDQRFF